MVDKYGMIHVAENVITVIVEEANAKANTKVSSISGQVRTLNDSGEEISRIALPHISMANVRDLIVEDNGDIILSPLLPSNRTYRIDNTAPSLSDITEYCDEDEFYRLNPDTMILSRKKTFASPK